MLRLLIENTLDRENYEMAEWIEKTLCEVTAFITKGIPPKYVDKESQDTVRVLNQKCNRNFEISYVESRLHNMSLKKVPSEKMLYAGDVLINSTGTGTAGRVAQIFEVPVPTTIDGHMILIRPTDEIDTLYYGYAIKGYQKKIESLAEGSTGQTEINRQRLQDEIIIRFPKDKHIQKSIGIFLLRIDEKIKNNEQINNNLEQQAMALYKSWFVDFELNSGVMPSDWKVSQLGSIAKISTEVFSPAKNPNVEVEHYSIPAYDEKHYPIFETSNGIKSNKYRLTSNSVMISKLNPDTKRIWRPYCISDNPICSTEFIVYEPIKPLNRDFIYSIIDSIGFSAFLCSHTTGSTNSRQRATPGITLTYDIVVPDEKTIQAFCSIVSPMYDTIENNIKENQKLAETRDKLLPKLMSGELDVSDIEL